MFTSGTRYHSESGPFDSAFDYLEGIRGRVRFCLEHMLRRLAQQYLPIALSVLVQDITIFVVGRPTGLVERLAPGKPAQRDIGIDKGYIRHRRTILRRSDRD